MFSVFLFTVPQAAVVVVLVIVIVIVIIIVVVFVLVDEVVVPLRSYVTQI